MFGFGKRKSNCVASGRSHSAPRILLLRRQIYRSRRREIKNSCRSSEKNHKKGAETRDRDIQDALLRRDGAGGFFPEKRRKTFGKRDQHHSGIYSHQYVPQALGGERDFLYRAG